MIGPVYDFADLVPSMDRVRWSGPIPPGLDRVTLDAHVESLGASLGLIFQSGEAVGRYLEVEMPDGTRRKLLRVARYVLARPSEVFGAVDAIVASVARDHGPGRVWSLAGHVHVVTDEPACIYGDVVDGEPHIRVRSWICHENGPAMSDEDFRCEQEAATARRAARDAAMTDRARKAVTP